MLRIRPVTVVAVLAGAVLASVAILVGSLGDGRRSAPGAVSDLVPDRELDLPLPRLEAVAPDGVLRDVLPAPGQPLLIDFWATWCGPCIAELPDLARLARDLEGRAGLVGVVTDGFEDAALDPAVLGEVSAYDLSYPNYFATEGTHRDLEAVDLAVRMIPTKLILDAGGRVRYVVLGGGREELCRRLLLELVALEDGRQGEHPG